jgi:blue copper oxidase
MSSKRRLVIWLLGAIAAVIAVCVYFGRRYFGGHSAQPFKPYSMNPVDAINFQQKLFIPIASGPFGVLDVAGPLRMRATIAKFSILPKLESPFLLYQTEQDGKAFQNPIFRVQRGKKFSLVFDNELLEPTIIHWHGLHTPAAMDGHPSTSIRSGARFIYDFVVRNRGGTYWYHTHAHNLTSKQAYNGLASFFLVEDDDQKRLSKSLDLTLGETDIPIVIQDKQFDAQGKLRYEPNPHESMMGWLGDIVVANLTPNAVLNVTRRIYRFRLLNGSNARPYRLAFIAAERRLNFMLIGSDGGLLEQAETETEVFISPGERIDILFDAGQVLSGAEVFLKSLPFDPMENEGMSGMGAMSSSRLPLGMAFNVLKLVVLDGARQEGKVSNPLSVVTPIRIEEGVARKIDLSMKGMKFLINGLSFQMNEIAFEVKRGSVEIWSINNPAVGMPHPMHMHGFSFQVIDRTNSPKQVVDLSRFGKGRIATDLGWKDTVLVWPGETVRIAIDFSHDFVGDQIYLFHCHNLEHEDGGMMINFRVKA